MNEFIKIDSWILTLDEQFSTKLLLYGDVRYESKINKSVVLASIKFIYSSKRFDGQLMWCRKQNICLHCLGFSFQCLSYYIDEPDNKVLSYYVNVLVFKFLLL